MKKLKPTLFYALVIILGFACTASEEYFSVPANSLPQHALDKIANTINRETSVDISRYMFHYEKFKYIKDIKEPFISIAVTNSKKEYKDIKFDKRDLNNMKPYGTDEKTIIVSDEFIIDTIKNTIKYINEATNTNEEINLRLFYELRDLRTTSGISFYNQGRSYQLRNDSLLNFRSHIKGGTYINSILHLDSNKQIVGVDYFKDELNDKNEHEMSLSRKFILNEHGFRKELYVYDKTRDYVMESNMYYFYDENNLLTLTKGADRKKGEDKPVGTPYESKQSYTFYKNPANGYIKVNVHGDNNFNYETIIFDEKYNWVSIKNHGLFKDGITREIVYAN